MVTLDYFLRIDVMVAMVPTTSMTISTYSLSEHILKLVIGAMVHHNV